MTQCDECNKEFLDLWSLFSHRKTHRLPRGQVRCILCGRVTRHPGYLYCDERCRALDDCLPKGD